MFFLLFVCFNIFLFLLFQQNKKRRRSGKGRQISLHSTDILFLSQLVNNAILEGNSFLRHSHFPFPLRVNGSCIGDRTTRSPFITGGKAAASVSGSNKEKTCKQEEDGEAISDTADEGQSVKKQKVNSAQTCLADERADDLHLTEKAMFTRSVF